MNVSASEGISLIWNGLVSAAVKTTQAIETTADSVLDLAQSVNAGTKEVKAVSTEYTAEWGANRIKQLQAQ